MRVTRALKLGARRVLKTVAASLPAGTAYRVAERLAPSVLRAKGKRLGRDTRALFPDRDPVWIAETVRRQQVHRAWVALDKIVLPCLSGVDLIARVDRDDLVDLRASIDTALEQRNGCIVLSMHFGRPMLGPRLFPLLGYRCSVIHAGMAQTRAERRFGKACRGADVEFIEAADRGCAMRAVRALSRNRLLFVLLDGGVARRRRNVPFLGQSISIPESIPRMARLADSAVVAGVVSTADELSFRVRVDVVTLSARDVAERTLGMSMATAFEAAVLADPGQWYGINRVFRRVDAPLSARDHEESESVGVNTWAS